MQPPFTPCSPSMLSLFSAFLVLSSAPPLVATPLVLNCHSRVQQKLSTPRTRQASLLYQRGISYPPDSATSRRERLSIQDHVPVAIKTVRATTQHAPSSVLYPQLSKTLDSLAYVDQWPQQRMFKQLPDSAGRDLEKVEMANFARHQPLLEKIVRQYGFPGYRCTLPRSASQ